MTDEPAPSASSSHAPPAPTGRRLAALTLATLGVVYGDIGTSPLYAMRESFLAGGGIDVTEPNVLGVISLIVWSLVFVISFKYLVFVMRADNHGEGGILALLALAGPSPATRRGMTFIIAGLFGTALLYGDGMITPAISVLSAVEGFAVAAPGVERFVIPVSVAILVGLFMVQSRGTGAVGAIFGPIMIVWFTVLAGLGIHGIAEEPGVLRALLPTYAIEFFIDHGARGIVVLGSVFLVVTGSEALYADMGHFGRRPITLGWFALVFPALVLNYAGQGASLLVDPANIENPFYRMSAEWTRFPLAVLATVATVIASQALITGAFSLTTQAIQLDYLPRVRVTHTSARAVGQVYVPIVNWALMLACVGLVLGFQSSSRLAAAYGVAVTMTMTITSLLLFLVMRNRWGWSLPAAGGLLIAFLAVDFAYLGANLLKIPHGGWFPLVVAGALFIVMSTWRQGRILVARRLQGADVPIDAFLHSFEEHPAIRTDGVTVFLHKRPLIAPPALLTMLRTSGSLPGEVILVAIITEEVARVPRVKRSEVTDLGHGFFQVVLRYGFMERPNIPEALASLVGDGPGFVPEATGYVLGRERVLPSPKKGMAPWREHLFAIMYRNASSSAEYFSLPPERVIEVGQQVEI
ncbi:MAG: potassium transporter Kup [Dehalococcoidia bacterium]|nr:potassium transporter Kup [Dehalococcoidia bacterium]MCB9483467.1 potassium transporter Kup [Dehalococcoidia bacterium]MCB9491528.1 potassium transporter Kup [Dehalococcoidia bacterium]